MHCPVVWAPTCVLYSAYSVPMDLINVCFLCTCVHSRSKSLSEAERRRIATSMDMRPISEEYELELK
jgi:hypothetical protein